MRQSSSKATSPASAKFPLSEGKDGKWSFDTEVGLQEIVNRRVGENELATIQTMHDYVNAQYEYARIDEDEDGVYEFAQRLISSPGKRDGLYWQPGVFDEETGTADRTQPSPSYAGDHGLFWEMHDAIFSNQHRLSVQLLFALAGTSQPRSTDTFCGWRQTWQWWQWKGKRMG